MEACTFEVSEPSIDNEMYLNCNAMWFKARKGTWLSSLTSVSIHPGNMDMNKNERIQPIFHFNNGSSNG